MQTAPSTSICSGGICIFGPGSYTNNSASIVSTQTETVNDAASCLTTTVAGKRRVILFVSSLIPHTRSYSREEFLLFSNLNPVSCFAELCSLVTVTVYADVLPSSA